MKKDYLVVGKKSKYNDFFTRIMLQSIICGIILVSLFCLWQIEDPVVIDKINTYIHQNMQWKSIYISLNELKNIMLDYIR